jgi:hypothetical protein
MKNHQRKLLLVINILSNNIMFTLLIHNDSEIREGGNGLEVKRGQVVTIVPGKNLTFSPQMTY